MNGYRTPRICQQEQARSRWYDGWNPVQNAAEGIQDIGRDYDKPDTWLSKKNQCNRIPTEPLCLAFQRDSRLWG